MSMISKLRRSSRAVAVAVATAALVAGAGAGSAAAADQAGPRTSVTINDTGWDFAATRPGIKNRVVVPLSWGDTGWD